jgi:hypothetical protein
MGRRETRLVRFDWSFPTLGLEILSKMVKHEKEFSDNQYVFIIFAFDTFSFPAPNIVNLLKIV